MALVGRNITDIRRAIRGALVGQTITGEYITITLNRAEDDRDAGLGAYEVVDGACLVRVLRGNTQDGFQLTTGDGNQLIQEWWTHALSVEFCGDVGSVMGERLEDDTTIILEKALDVIRATLNPAQLGQNQYDVSRVEYDAPARHPRSPNLYLWVIRVYVKDWWRISQ